MGVRILRVDLSALMISENEQKHRAVVTHRKARHLLAGEAIADIDILVSRAVSFHRKRGDHVSKIFLESVVISEYQFPNDRMEAIGSDHHLEISRWFALEMNTYTIFVLVDLLNTITENGFTMAFDLLVNDLG